MALQAYAPTRIFETVRNSKFRIANPIWAIEGLQEKVLEPEVLKTFRVRGRLGIDELKFLSRQLDELRACLWAYANPINSGRSSNRPVGFYGDGKAVRMDGLDKKFVELEEGFATREDDVAVVWPSAPSPKHCVGELR